MANFHPVFQLVKRSQKPEAIKCRTTMRINMQTPNKQRLRIAVEPASDILPTFSNPSSIYIITYNTYNHGKGRAYGCAQCSTVQLFFFRFQPRRVPTSPVWHVVTSDPCSSRDQNQSRERDAQWKNAIDHRLYYL